MSLKPGSETAARPSIPLRAKKAESREAFQKRVTSVLLRYALKTVRTKVIIIMGHLRSGKSSLFEALTGLNGYSANGVDSVTQEYHLGRAYINQEFYLFVDTPGLSDTGRKTQTFFEKSRDFLTSQKTLSHSLGLEFLEHFCGLEYSPFLTFVTNLWDECSDGALERHNFNMEQMEATKWERFITKGASVYHHGRAYEDGAAKLKTLSFRTEQEERRQNELRSNVPLEGTLAGRYLQMSFNQLVVTSILCNGADHTAQLFESENEGGRESPQASQPAPTGGLDWIGTIFSTIVDVVNFPLKLIASLLGALWDLIKILGGLIFILHAQLWQITDEGVEVLVTLIGNYKVVLGHGRTRGIYWKPFNAEEDTHQLPDEDILNRIIMELNDDEDDLTYTPGSVVPTVSPAMTEAGDEIDGDQRYHDFSAAFEQARARQTLRETAP
ncbi:hypothetical protein BDV06DRAFT_218374 [Aspergillus oleicola]